ncbi:MAG TPA: TonB-dependent receptor [Proteobacteria bacterium]|nr:TonB-dependent receptor [Pseudomonadota bacterium]
MIRGPGSVLYGSDALGGVVNMITKDPFKELGLRGSHGALYSTNNREFSHSHRVQYSAEKFYVAARARLRDAENFHTPTEEVDNTFYHDTSLNFGVGLRPHPKHTIRVDSQHYMASSLGKGATDLDDEKRRRIFFPDDQNHRVVLKYEAEELGAVERINTSVFSNWTKRRQQIDIYTTDWERRQLQTRKEGDFWNGGGQTYLTAKLSATDRLTVGADGYYKILNQKSKGYGFLDDGTKIAGDEERAYDDAKMWAEGVFAQNRWDISKLFSTSLGVRYDWVTSHVDQPLRPGEEKVQKTATDQALSGGLGFLLHPVERLTIAANAGRAFRAPTLEEKFIAKPTCFGVYCGNPDLTPETSWSFDLGVKGDLYPVIFEVYGYYTRLYDMINITPTEAEDCDYIYDNIEEAQLAGTEAFLALEFWDIYRTYLGLRPYVSFSYVVGDNLTKDEPLCRIPPLEVESGLRIFGRAKPALKDYYLELSGTYNAKQDRVAEGEEKSDEFFIANLKLGITYGKFLVFRSADVSVKVENLFNTEYRHHLSKFDGKGRDVRLAVRLNY